MEHVLENGYVARDVLSGIEVNDEHGSLVCVVGGTYLSRYENEDGTIDEDRLSEEIRLQIDVDEFIDYQQEYC